MNNTDNVRVESEEPLPSDISMEEDSILNILEELYQEANFEGQTIFEPKFAPPCESAIVHTSFRPKSSFFPHWAKGRFISTFYDTVFNTFKTKFDKPMKTIMNIDKNAAPIDALKQNKDIIIRKADKGGSLVIQNRDEYLSEARRLLGDTQTYAVLKRDPTLEYTKELKILLDDALSKEVLTKNEYLFLYNRHAATPHFYHIPKVHKSLLNPPGRPIISGIDSLSSNLGCYIDHFLQDIVVELPSFVKDSGHVLEILSNYKWLPGYRWLSLDVASLYTSINHTFGLRAINHFLLKDDRMNSRQAKFLLDCVEFSLTHNYFSFLGDHYLQIKGTAMGARFAPSYANIFMGFWEEHFIWKNNPFGANLVLYARYIDDILIIWDGSDPSLQSFLEHCKNNPFGIEFTHVLDEKCLVFLDLELQSDQDGNIFSKTHFKPSGGNSYLHAKSNHHPRWIQNVPFGQFCRLRRTCTKKEDYLEQSKLLMQKFSEKGYEANHIESAFSKYLALYDDPSNNDSNNTEPRHQTTPVTQQACFSTQYTSKAFEIQSIIKKNWNILKHDPVLGKTLPDHPNIVFRKPQDLRSLIAPSRVKTSTSKPTNSWATIFDQKGCYRCGIKNCGTCMYMWHRKKTVVGRDGKIHPIKQFINCGTEYVVYGIVCPCGRLYVGRTQRPMRVRIGEHKCGIINLRDKYPVPRHFVEVHQGDPAGMKVFGIESIGRELDIGRRYQRLCKREAFWIFTLGSLAPGGLNEDPEVHKIV